MSEFFRVYGPVFITIVQLLLLWFLWSLRHEFTTTKKCEDHRKDMAGKCSQNREKLGAELKEPAAKATSDLEALKSKVDRLPDREEVRDFTKSVMTLNSALGELKGRVDGINRAVDLMNQHHLNESGKK